MQATGRTPPRKLASCHNPAAAQVPAPFKSPTPQPLDGLLDGFCPEPRVEERLAVNSNGRLLLLRLADIDWLEAAANCVELHIGKETHLLGDTLTAVATKLPPGRFLRLSPSVLVNVRRTKNLRQLCRGEWQVLLHNGTRLTSTYRYGDNPQQGTPSLTLSMKSLARFRLSIER